MAHLSKRMRFIQQQVDVHKMYPAQEAIQLLQSLPPLKCGQSLELSVHLTVSSLKKTDRVVRGIVILPHGTGRKARVIVFAQEREQVEAAKEAGAARVGFEELVNEVKQGEFALDGRDVLIATPAAMRLLVPLGAMLGPKGLMPNPKLGTVTDDPASVVRDALLGRVQYCNDKGGIIRCLVGRLSFDAEQLQANVQTVLLALLKNKPESAPKGKAFIKKITLSSTMGPGLWVDQDSLELAALS
jgi:large subunit ribosomal protein L1